MLKSQGFDVIDLGVDVPTDRFVETVKKEKPDVLAMSGLLTIVKDEMKKVIDDRSIFCSLSNLNKTSNSPLFFKYIVVDPTVEAAENIRREEKASFPTYFNP